MYNFNRHYKIIILSNNIFIFGSNRNGNFGGEVALMLICSHPNVLQVRH